MGGRARTFDDALHADRALVHARKGRGQAVALPDRERVRRQRLSQGQRAGTTKGGRRTRRRTRRRTSNSHGVSCFTGVVTASGRMEPERTGAAASRSSLERGSGTLSMTTGRAVSSAAGTSTCDGGGGGGGGGVGSRGRSATTVSAAAPCGGASPAGAGSASMVTKRTKRTKDLGPRVRAKGKGQGQTGTGTKGVCGGAHSLCLSRLLVLVLSLSLSPLSSQSLSPLQSARAQKMARERWGSPQSAKLSSAAREGL